MNIASRIAPPLLWLAACGGNVVVDGTMTSTGTGGASTTTGITTTTPTVTSGDNCAGVPDPSVLTLCAGQTGPECDLTYCDPQANKWEEICSNGSCQCKKNGALVCTCSIAASGFNCTATPACCFGK